MERHYDGNYSHLFARSKMFCFDLKFLEICQVAFKIKTIIVLFWMAQLGLQWCLAMDGNMNKNRTKNPDCGTQRGLCSSSQPLALISQSLGFDIHACVCRRLTHAWDGDVVNLGRHGKPCS